MKKHPILALLLVLTPAAVAADPVSSCLDQEIKIQALTVENAALAQQLLCNAQCQQQFKAIGQASDAAKAEQARLEALRPQQPKEAAKENK